MKKSSLFESDSWISFPSHRSVSASDWSHPPQSHDQSEMKLKVTKWYRLFIFAAIWIGAKQCNQWMESRAQRRGEIGAIVAWFPWRTSLRVIHIQAPFLQQQATVANCFCFPTIVDCSWPSMIEDPKNYFNWSQYTIACRLQMSDSILKIRFA